MVTPRAPSWALITGASSGLGRALARRCARDGWNLVLVARRQEALQELARQLEAVQVLTVPLDLRRNDAIDHLQERLAAAQIPLSRVGMLINNAGVGDHGPFTDLPADRLEAMLQVNVAAVTRLVYRFAREMTPGSTICTVASVAAFTPGPLMAVYYATKAYVLSLGEALHRELHPRGIRVVTVCPGPFRSEFHAAAGIREARGLPSEDRVARRVLAAIRRGRPVAPVGFGARVWAWVGPRLPRSWAVRIIHALQRRR